MDASTHVREERHPLGALDRLRQSHRKQEDEADEIARGVDREDDAEVDHADEEPGDERPGDIDRAVADTEERVRFLQLARRHDLLDEPGRGGPEERRAGADHERRDHEVPERHRVGEEDDREKRLRRRPHEVGGDHDELTREPVRPDASSDDEHDACAHERREDEAQVGRRPRQVEDCERERDGYERLSGLGDEARSYVQAELTIREDCEARETGGHDADPREGLLLRRDPPRRGRRARRRPTSHPASTPCAVCLRA